MTALVIFIRPSSNPLYHIEDYWTSILGPGDTCIYWHFLFLSDIKALIQIYYIYIKIHYLQYNNISHLTENYYTYISFNKPLNRIAGNKSIDYNFTMKKPKTL